MNPETTTRVLVAVVGIPLAVAAAYAGGWVLTGVLAVVAILAALEYYHLAAKKSARPDTVLGACGAAAFVILAGFRPDAGPGGAGFGTAAIVLFLLASTTSIWRGGVAGQPLLSTSVTAIGAIYTGATLSFALFLRHLPATDGTWHGTVLVFTPIAITWINDSCAYFVGRRFGRKKLIPSVSPGKTVAGAVGAIVGSVLTAVAIGMFLRGFSTYRIEPWEAVTFGILVSVAAQAGDLVESLFKRDAAVKDSGALLPGHGGALDRLDALFFTLPLGYFYFRYFVGSLS